jgi:AcrR family transcriptional regulator
MIVLITVSQESISKPPRAYRSELRQQQAAQTRSRILAAAADLFAAEGYARTTLAKIAAAAGVSVETVQGQGPKAALLIAAAEFAGVGVSGEESVLNLELGRRLVAINDPDQALDDVATAATGIHKGSAKLTPALLGGANSDPELDRFLDEFIAGINQQIWRICDVFHRRGWLRDDVPFDELVETCAVLCSAETYYRMTHREGWSPEAYRTWLRRMLAETVFRGGNQ